MNTLKVLVLMTLAVFAIAACDTNDGGAENVGEAIDNAGDKLGDAATDAGNAIEDACEDVKEGVNADDTDC